MKNTISKFIKTLSVLALLFAGTVTSISAQENAKEYECTFTYSMTVASGKGSSGENVTPVVKVDFENRSVTLPPFVFTESKTIMSFTIDDVAFTEESDGTITFYRKSFECNSGVLPLKGSDLKGTISNDKLTLTVKYKAGKMPFSLSLKYSGTEI